MLLTTQLPEKDRIIEIMKNNIDKNNEELLKIKN